MKTYSESRLTDLLIEFDEMGFCPTTVCPHPEQYAIEWKEQVVKEIQKLQAENAELRHRAEVAEERLKKLKKTEGDLTVEEEINILENLVAEAKHRSFVFERELVKYKMAFDRAIKLAYKIRTDFDVLSCSSCEFGYAFDVCKKTGVYSDCENRWKEELLQQVESEIEEEKND